MMAMIFMCGSLSKGNYTITVLHVTLVLKQLLLEVLTITSLGWTQSNLEDFIPHLALNSWDKDIMCPHGIMTFDCPSCVQTSVTVHHEQWTACGILVNTVWRRHFKTGKHKFCPTRDGAIVIIVTGSVNDPFRDFTCIRLKYLHEKQKKKCY
jgi:hypothetical protein